MSQLLRAGRKGEGAALLGASDEPLLRDAQRGMEEALQIPDDRGEDLRAGEEMAWALPGTLPRTMARGDPGLHDLLCHEREKSLANSRRARAHKAAGAGRFGLGLRKGGKIKEKIKK